MMQWIIQRLVIQQFDQFYLLDKIVINMVYQSHKQIKMIQEHAVRERQLPIKEILKANLKTYQNLSQGNCPQPIKCREEQLRIFLNSLLLNVYINQKSIVEKMKLYTDAFSGQEIISDSYPMIFDFENTICRVKSRLIVTKETDVDIGCGNAFGGEAPEEGAEKKDQNVEKVIDVINAFGYEETSFDKPGYMGYLKEYGKKVLQEYLSKKKADRVEKFKEGWKAFFIFMKNNFDKLELKFYTAKDFDSTNIVILSYYDGEDEAPTFLYTMDGLKEEKV